MATTLPGLPTKVQRCVDCPNGIGRAVGARGNPQAPLVIVGEAPGKQEFLTGKPFVGPSGKLLHKTAEKVGLCVHEETTFFTNALRCTYPVDESPKKSMLVCCQDRLHTELRLIERNLILAMGNSALRSVTGNFNAKITRMRGIVIETEFGLTLPTFHPAAILRNPNNYYLFERDMQYAAEMMEHGPVAIKNMNAPAYEVVTEQRCDAVVRHLMEQPVLAADIETTGLNWSRDELLCIGIRGCDSIKTYIFPRELSRLKYLKYLFTNYEGKWIWHNGKFDTLFLEQRGIPARIDNDTLLLHYALDEQPGRHGLKQLSADFLGAPVYDEDITFNGETPELHQYLAWDVQCTLDLFNIFHPQVIGDPALKQLYERILIPASEFLRRLEQIGLFVNTEYLTELETSLSEQLIGVNANIQEAVAPWWSAELYAHSTGAKPPKDGKFNPGSPKQLQWLLFSREAMGMRPPKGYSQNTQADTLENMHPNPITPLILEARGISKRLSTYVRSWRTLIEQSPDKRLHPSFSLHTTETGRLSSSNPNVQNVPRGPEIRNAIQAPEGRRLIEMDYSQAELRTLAWISDDPFLKNVYERGEDLHAEVARQLDPDYDNLPPDEKAEVRVAAKGVNFGIAYGLTANGLVRDMPHLSISEAEQYIRTWLTNAAKAAEFLERCRRVARTGGTITTPFGRKRRFGPLRAENVKHMENQASNFPIQSVASDLTLISAIRIQNMFDAESYSANVINIVHDSILIEAVDDSSTCQHIVEQATDIMRRTPVDTLGIDVPFDTDWKTGYRWGDLTDS